MRRIRFPLFKKFALTITLIVIVFGTINVYLLWKISIQSNYEEIESRLVLVSKIISKKVVEPILYEDYVNLYSILEEIQQADTSIYYIFISNKSNQIIARTFANPVSQNIINSNATLHSKYNIQYLTIIKSDLTLIDIAYPILEGEIGTLRIGIKTSNLRDKLIESSGKLLLMTLIFLIVGLLGAFIFAHLISKPIKLITSFFHDFTPENQNRFVIKKPWYKKIFKNYFYDELDLLTEKFTEMNERLISSYKKEQETQKHLLQSEKLASIGTLAAGIAHEINNPLAGILNGIKRLSKSADDFEQNKQYLVLMREAVNRMSSVVNGLLNFSKKHDFKIEKINISKVIDNALNLIDYDIRKNNVWIIKEYPNKVPPILGSKNHLEQVFLNLLLNSIEAIKTRFAKQNKHNGLIKIVILNKKNKLWIWIIDNGIGVDKKDMDVLFDPFFTKKTNGTGLGLSISYSIIKDHEGIIRATPNEFNGLTILIELPYT